MDGLKCEECTWCKKTETGTYYADCPVLVVYDCMADMPDKKHRVRADDFCPKFERKEYADG